MCLIDSAPDNLDSAVQCKRMMMLREHRVFFHRLVLGVLGEWVSEFWGC